MAPKISRIPAYTTKHPTPPNILHSDAVQAPAQYPDQMGSQTTNPTNEQEKIPHAHPPIEIEVSVSREEEETPEERDDEGDDDNNNNNNNNNNNDEESDLSDEQGVIPTEARRVAHLRLAKIRISRTPRGQKVQDRRRSDYANGELMGRTKYGMVAGFPCTNCTEAGKVCYVYKPGFGGRIMRCHGCFDRGGRKNPSRCNFRYAPVAFSLAPVSTLNSVNAVSPSSALPHAQVLLSASNRALPAPPARSESAAGYGVDDGFAPVGDEHHHISLPEHSDQEVEDVLHEEGKAPNYINRPRSHGTIYTGPGNLDAINVDIKNNMSVAIIGDPISVSSYDDTPSQQIVDPGNVMKQSTTQEQLSPANLRGLELPGLPNPHPLPKPAPRTLIAPFIRRTPKLRLTDEEQDELVEDMLGAKDALGKDYEKIRKSGL
ncbi:hypothetical protein P154DRAFT_539918 [Amniculicola lignicola CBS 123094]|uniref:Uncharacterized protein n=1 Tax=Amniculicola lignicola CBS 123094 TaxID=1392246 RepID=A0A6A5VZB7_9PLEO|nr:hypothetical protein P154DRAFT_539918 [Amniculicola lignicola CBS 123094]